MELGAQLATMGLKRGLAQQLATTDKPHVCVVWDGLASAFIASAIASVLLMIFPQAMFPAGDIRGAEWLLPLVIFGIAGADVALAALAYRHDVASTVHVRAIVEPWVISIAAGAFVFTQFQRDGLILAYVLSVVAGLAMAFWRLFRSYGVPYGWRPDIEAINAVARRNYPLAAADAIEWSTRRLDIAILGLFVAPYWVGIYYVAQQVASLPQKLKTSFDPILAPVITQKLAEGDKAAVARQVRQVGFWIIAAQTGIALALGITGRGGDGPGRPAIRRRRGGARLPARGRGGGGDGGRLGSGAGLCRAPSQPADLAADDRGPGGDHGRDHRRARTFSIGPRTRSAARPSRRPARRSASCSRSASPRCSRRGCSRICSARRCRAGAGR